MAVTHDKKYFFRGCQGVLIRHSLHIDEPEKRYRLPIHQTDSIYITHNDRYVFIGSNDEKLFQFSIKKEKCVKVYDLGSTPDSMTGTHDSKNLYIGCLNGNLVQISVKRQIMIKHFQEIIDDRIYALAVSPNDKYLCVGGGDGNLKIISIENSKIIKNFGIICGTIFSIAIDQRNQNLFLGDNNGKLLKIS